jgi:hypothetical protein
MMFRGPSTKLHKLFFVAQKPFLIGVKVLRVLMQAHHHQRL